MSSYKPGADPVKRTAEEKPPLGVAILGHYVWSNPTGTHHNTCLVERVDDDKYKLVSSFNAITVIDHKIAAPLLWAHIPEFKTRLKPTDLC